MSKWNRLKAAVNNSGGALLFHASNRIPTTTTGTGDERQFSGTARGHRCPRFQTEQKGRVSVSCVDSTVRKEHQRELLGISAGKDGRIMILVSL